jgi:hypothetical protein
MTEAMMPQLRLDRRGLAVWLASPNAVKVGGPLLWRRSVLSNTEARVQPRDPPSGMQRADSDAGAGAYLSSHML